MKRDLLRFTMFLSIIASLIACSSVKKSELNSKDLADAKMEIQNLKSMAQDVQADLLAKDKVNEDTKI